MSVVTSRGGTKRDFGVEDQRIARHPENSSTWKYKLRGLAQAATTFIQRPPNTFKHKIFFYLSMKATQDHFWFCFSAFFFFSRRYLHLHLFTALSVFTQSRIQC